ncbi:rhamnosidase B [Fusarium agapanthi]|uniref:Rhamnosidase B n=1 Tax=Fusarium agapanthi TaxID=1803897 RepID=A0A9P5BFS5_9HYPO|nr:rhamnosidase B [Fusarium agapanthi]
MRWEITAGAESVELCSFGATQVNYPLAVKASWDEPGDKDAKQIWDVSIRTMRNCMFDGYSDCPFYEQLQYSGDSHSVGLFHYLLSGDDRLMRQTITNFAASVTPEGLTQSRFPSHVPQIIAGFSLYWVLQICDHHLYFGDTAYTRSFLPRIDGVFEFFESHIDELGLVSGFPEDVWHMLYAYVLKQAARLVRDVGRPGYADEYESRAASVVNAIRIHCFDGKFFTDSTADIAGEGAYSQHCQVFAVLSGAATPEDRPRLLREPFSNPDFSKCSYVMMFYALRAFALAGDEVYESAWGSVWDPWRKMLANNLTIWEEDDVRQRSDCHAWGSVPIYGCCTELAGLHIIAPGSSKILFSPRLNLSRELKAKAALGSSNTATVSWSVQDDGKKKVELRLKSPVRIVSKFPGGEEKDCGVVDHLTLSF